MHDGDMAVERKTVRQSISLPAKVATPAQTEKRKQQEFLDLAKRFRDETDPETARRLGDELGRTVFRG